MAFVDGGKGPSSLYAASLTFFFFFFKSVWWYNLVYIRENYWIFREYHKCILSPLTWIVSPTINLILMGPTVIWEEEVRIYGIPKVSNNYPYISMYHWYGKGLEGFFFSFFFPFSILETINENFRSRTNNF